MISFVGFNFEFSFGSWKFWPLLNFLKFGNEQLQESRSHQRPEK